MTVHRYGGGRQQGKTAAQEAAIRRADALRDAFELLMLHDMDAAARAIAQAQIMKYSVRQWARGLPTVDAMGNDIVFQDNHGSRYCVYMVQPSGSHIKVHMGDARNLGPFLQFEAWGPDSQTAANLAARFVEERQLRDVTTESVSLPGLSGWTGLRYSHGRSLD